MNNLATSSSWLMITFSLLSLVVLIALAGGQTPQTTSWSKHPNENNNRRLETCSGICPIGFEIEFPANILPINGVTCQEANDKLSQKLEGSVDCNRAKRQLSYYCGCVPSSTTASEEETDSNTNSTSNGQVTNSTTSNYSYNSKKVRFFSSEKQKRALNTIPHITGMLSLLGSLFVIQDIVRDRKKLKRTYIRLVLGMSIVDAFSSLGFFFGIWAIAGSTAFCSFQGFLIQLGVAAPIYNACLAIYYLLVLKFKWSERKIRAIEKYMHSLPTGFGFVTSILGAILTLYNSAGMFCHIASAPFYCRKWDLSCDRGEYSHILVWVFFFGPIWACVLVTTISMAAVSMHVKKEEKASRRWRSASFLSGDNDHAKQLSTQVFWQCVLYVSVFYLTWVFPTIHRILLSTNLLIPGDKASFWVVFFTAMIMPLQGFLNFFIYLYPRYARKRSLDASYTWWHSARSSIFYCLPAINFFEKCTCCLSVCGKSPSNNGQEGDAGSTACRPSKGDTPENLDPELPKEELIEDADVMDPAYILSLSYRNENKDRSEHDNENRL